MPKFLFEGKKLKDCQAAWDHYRSVRIWGDQKHYGLCTVAYSYNLTPEQMSEAAERLTLCWNLAYGTTTAALREVFEGTKTVEIVVVEDGSNLKAFDELVSVVADVVRSGGQVSDETLGRAKRALLNAHPQKKGQ